MSVNDSRIIHLSNSRRDSSSTIYELVEDSESSTSSSSEDDYWVAFSFIHPEKPKKHESKKHAKVRVNNEAKEMKKKTVYFMLEEDRHSLVPRQTQHRSHKSHKTLSKREELNDPSRYSIVAPPHLPLPQPLSLPQEQKKCGLESDSTPPPIQRKMRPSHREGVFEGARPKRSVSAISLDRKRSHQRRRSSSEAVRSVDSCSRLGHKEYSVNQDSKMRELVIDMPTPPSEGKKGSKKPETLYGIAIVKCY